MSQPFRTKNYAQLAATLQISQFKSDTLQTMGCSLSTPSIFFYLYGRRGNLQGAQEIMIPRLSFTVLILIHRIYDTFEDILPTQWQNVPA